MIGFIVIEGSLGTPFLGNRNHTVPPPSLFPHRSTSLLDPPSTSQTINIQLPMPIRPHIRAPHAFPAIRVRSLADERPGHVIGCDGAAVVARGCHWSAEVEPREGVSGSWICLLLLLQLQTEFREGGILDAFGVEEFGAAGVGATDDDVIGADGAMADAVGFGWLCFGR